MNIQEHHIRVYIIFELFREYGIQWFVVGGEGSDMDWYKTHLGHIFVYMENFVNFIKVFFI